MGFIECIFRKAHHGIKYPIRHLRRYSLADTAGHALSFVSEYKIIPLLFHHIVLFLTHGTAHQIRAAQGISSQVADDLHYLLLIHYTAIGRLQYGAQLLAGIGDLILIIFTLDIFGYEIHGAGSVKGYARDDILQ